MNMPECSGQPIILWQKMKKLSTPQKSSLKEDQGRLDALMRSPGEKELELRNRLLGKNTLQAARIIAEEFVARFGETSGTVEYIVERLLPAGRAKRWEDLDLQINLFCKQYYTEWEVVATFSDGREQVLGTTQRYGDAEVEFMDRVRFVLYSLSRQRDYKPSEKQASYRSVSEMADDFATCFLCWRSVLRKPFEKKTPLCALHNMESTLPEYRSRKEMRKKMLEIKAQLRKLVPTPAWVKEHTKIHPRDFFAAMCVSPEGFFPYLAQHLRFQNIPLNTLEGIMQALEHPVDFKLLSEQELAAWQFHFDDLGAFFERNYDRLLTAEAWLQAEAGHKRGGKREKGNMAK